MEATHVGSRDGERTDPARDRIRFKDRPDRRVAVSIDRLFNRLYSIPDPEDLVRELVGTRIEKTYYDRLTTKLKHASEFIAELRRLLKSDLTPVRGIIWGVSPEI